MAKDEFLDIPTQKIDKNNIMLEYNALRDEILKRIELRQQIISITLVLLTAILSVTFAQEGLKENFSTLKIPSLAFIYPPIATSLALGWIQHEYRINLLGYYIHEHIEKSIPCLGWEKHVIINTSEGSKLKWYYILLSHGGVFIWTEIIAIIVGIFMFRNTSLESGFIALDILSLLIIITVMFNLYIDTKNQKDRIIAEEK